MAEAPDINVDELRRRARRRLIGAIVLALAAAVIVPMLLESDPKPLGEDVSVKIPPEDGGKFVNRLSEKAGKPGTPAPAPRGDAPRDSAKDAAKDAAPAPADAAANPPAAATSAAMSTDSAPAPSNVPAPKKSLAQAEQKMLGATPKPAPTAPVAAPAAAPSAKPAASPAAAPPAGVTSAAAPAASAATSVAKPAPTSTPAADAPREAFSVQLAAFADDKGANSLANRLKRADYPAYTEPLTTSKGTLWRVRVGPYPSRDAAIEVRDKLKSEGYSGIVAVAK